MDLRALKSTLLSNACRWPFLAESYAAKKASASFSYTISTPLPFLSGEMTRTSDGHVCNSGARCCKQR